MIFRVRFVRGGATHLELETAPFVAPEHTYGHDASLPARLVSVTKTWTLEGVLYGAAGQTPVDAWTALTTKLEDPAAYPDGIELLRDGTVVESIAVASGYVDWRVERLASPRTDFQWLGELRFTLRVSGRRPLARSSKDKASSLDLTESWSYDAAGLLTRTLTGEIEVTDGSAAALARTLGLALPGDHFGFLTAGPEGVDVERLDPDDRKARFTSTIRESGAALPKGVAPGFSVEVESAVRDGVETRTTRVTATGEGAVAAVQAHPAAGLADAISMDTHARTARGVFVETRPVSGTQVLRAHRFLVSGGGRPRAFTKRTGGRRPVEHVLAYEPADVIEQIEVASWGPPATSAIKLPSPVVGVAEDLNAWRLAGPERTATARDKAADEWTTRVTRVYRAASLEKVFAPLLQSVLVPGGGTTLEEEIARVVKG